MVIGASVIAAIALSSGVNSTANQDPGSVRDFGITARSVILDRFAQLTCGEAPCEPATDEERSTPPVSDEEAERIAMVAMVSAMAEHCGLDWYRLNFAPMMAGWRADPDASERRLAMIAGIHGTVQGFTLNGLQERGACGTQTRAAVHALLDGN